MYIDQINLNNIRVFECVFRNRSMTKAAGELHITQSGVSQHIKSLEDVLEVKLFDRIKQRIVPTKEAEALFDEWSGSLLDIEKTLVNLKGGELSLVGNVRVGIPIEFGNNMILPLLAQFAQMHPRVTYDIKYGHASDMNDSLLHGELDFAFLDDFALDRQIQTEVVYHEVHELCASKEYYEKHPAETLDKKYFESLDYMDYLKDEPVLRGWFKHHLGAPNITLKARAHLMDVQGIQAMITSGLGLGILPRHQIKKIDQEKTPLHIFSGSGTPLKNKISVAYVKAKTQTPVITELLSYLSESLKVH